MSSGDCMGLVTVARRGIEPRALAPLLPRCSKGCPSRAGRWPARHQRVVRAMPTARKACKRLGRARFSSQCPMGLEHSDQVYSPRLTAVRALRGEGRGLVGVFRLADASSVAGSLRSVNMKLCVLGHVWKTFGFQAFGFDTVPGPGPTGHTWWAADGGHRHGGRRGLYAPLCARPRMPGLRQSVRGHDGRSQHADMGCDVAHECVRIVDSGCVGG